MLTYDGKQMSRKAKHTVVTQDAAGCPGCAFTAECRIPVFIERQGCAIQPSNIVINSNKKSD